MSILVCRMEYTTKLYINFFNFEKTFDSLNRDPLRKLLRDYGVPGTIGNIIRKSYKDNRTELYTRANYQTVLK